MATASAVTFGVVNANPQSTGFVAASVNDATGTPTAADLGEEARGTKTVSRNAPRIDKEPTKVEKYMAGRAVAAAIRNAETQEWTTATLNLWDQPGEEANKVGELAEGKKVLVTGRALYERVEVVVDGESRWVTAGYLSDEEPAAVLGGECTNGSSVPSGVSENIKLVHAAVCTAFRELTSYGTFRSDGEHAQGIAIDIMVSGDRGWEVADFVRENYAELGVSYVIYSQNIWSVERSGEGWRGMSDRGSTTANHYDHGTSLRTENVLGIHLRTFRVLVVGPDLGC